MWDRVRRDAACGARQEVASEPALEGRGRLVTELKHDDIIERRIALCTRCSVEHSNAVVCVAYAGQAEDQVLLVLGIHVEVVDVTETRRGYLHVGDIMLSEEMCRTVT